jgi:methionine--tRNA ligase beta chain
MGINLPEKKLSVHEGIFVFEIFSIFAIIVRMTIDEFQKADLRVGKVVAAERIEGSEKLLKLMVDIGEPRQIIAGIMKSYVPEDLVGREVVIVANLEPRMMMGLESQGMILAAHGENGEPIVLSVEREVPAGSKIS